MKGESTGWSFRRGSGGIAGRPVARFISRVMWQCWPVIAAAALFAATAWPVPAAAGERASTSADARAIIVTRLSFIKTQDLDFGAIVAGNTAGTVTIAPNGVRTKTGGVVLAGAGGQPASFSGYGFPNQNVLISISATTGTMTRQGGTETMRFDTFVIGSSPTTQLTTAPRAFRISSATGVFAFPLGATLRVNARQRSGIYRGTFSVVLQYQ